MANEQLRCPVCGHVFSHQGIIGHLCRFHGMAAEKAHKIVRKLLSR